MTSRWANPINNNILRDLEGTVLAGGDLEFYEAGTSTPLAVYSDSALSVSLGSSITADAFGLIADFHMAAGTEYKMVAKDSGGTTKWTRDEVFSLDSSVDTRLDALESTVGAISTLSNNVINSSCAAIVENGSGIAAEPPAISSSFQEGSVAGQYAKATNSSAGTVGQGTSASVTAGYYCSADAVTTTDAGSVVVFQSRVLSGDSGVFVNGDGVFTCYVYQDTGAAVDVTVTLKKADAKDNFSSLTTIQASSATSVSSGTWTQITFSHSAFGDCRNGIAIETSFACGVQTTKNYYYTMPQLTDGTTAVGWIPDSQMVRQYEPRKYTPGHINGLGLSIDADTEHDIQIATGSCRDSSDTIDIDLTSVLTKQIDSTWQEGDDQGGWPTGVNSGSPASSTWYYVFLIATTSGKIDAGFDSSSTAANLLSDASGYSYYRRIGWILTDGSSNLTSFIHTPLDNRWDWSVPTSSTPSVTATASSVTAVAPPLSTAILSVAIDNGGTSAQGIVTSLDTTDTAPTATLCNFADNGSAAPDGPNASNINVRLDSSSQFRIRGTASIGSTSVVSFGWFDHRGV